MKYTIYKITNLVNGKIYIGKHQTKDLDDGYMGSGKLLKRAIAKYGLDNFRKEILFVFDSEEEMNRKEAELVDEGFVLREDTYNLCVGGYGGFSYINSTPGARNGFESRQCIDQISGEIGRKRMKVLRESDPEWRASHSRSISNGMKKYQSMDSYINPFQGKTHSKEWRETHSRTMKQRQKGEKNSQFGTMWITDGISNAKIQRNEPIPDGWYKGRKL